MQRNARYYQTPEREQLVWERYQIAETLARFPALTLKVLFRPKVGLRRAEPAHLFLLAGILLVLNFIASVMEWIANLPTHGPPVGTYRIQQHLLPYFALAVVVAGLWQHRNRWSEIRSGVFLWHTYGNGISPFEIALAVITPPSKTQRPFPLTPNWWLSEGRIPRFVDPLVLLAIGYFLYPVDWALAYWIMFAAACLAVDENLTWRAALKIYLDMVDNRINADAMKQWTVTTTRPSSRSGRNGGKRKDAAVPTGIGADILQHLEANSGGSQGRRSQRRAQPSLLASEFLPDAPDNLAAMSGGSQYRNV